ncbi:MAG: alanine--glyoxylate aminotransferase family protein [archaeon]
MHKKLFIPGPTEVNGDVLAEMARPMIPHRGSEFSELYRTVIPKVQRLLYTGNKIFLSTSSATGLMEGAVRNCVKKKCLSLVCGAFSKRWHEITLANGKEADALEVPWGMAIKPEMVDERLSTGEYDAVTLVHNETSTGIQNPLKEIAGVVRKYPDVMFMVDTVSSMGGIRIDVDELGIDVCLASVQKALALPPGFAICSISQGAFKRSEQVKNRGYYFDFQAFLKYDGKGETIVTPSIPHFYALNRQLDRMFAEGLENRFARHTKMAEICREWARRHFGLYPEAGYESDTLTVIRNTRQIDVSNLNAELAKKGKCIANGYGKIKDETFRIAHLGELTVADINELLRDIKEFMDNS